MKIEIYSQPDVVVRATATVGEGPVFDPRTGYLCWVDIDNGCLYEEDLTAGRQTLTTFDTKLGAVAPRREHAGYSAAISSGFGLISDGVLSVVDESLPEPSRRMNDAKCDKHGRMWAGSTHVDYLAGAGALHRWAGVEPSVVIASGFTLPNGIGWKPDYSVMYLVDSFAQHLLYAKFDVDDGEVGRFAPLCDFPVGLPDGLALDMDGCIWVAIWGGHEVVRLDPSGKLLARVRMPVSQPSSCAMTEDGTLYITSARAGLDGRELDEQPLAGSVFAVSTTASGMPVSPFDG